MVMSILPPCVRCAMTWSGLMISTSCVCSMSAAVTAPGAAFFSLSVASGNSWRCFAFAVPRPVRGASPARYNGLLRIEFDDELLVDVAREFRAVGKRLEDALEVLGIDLDPAREAVLLGELERALDAQLGARLLAHRDGVGGAHEVRRDVHGLAVHLDRLVRHELARFRASRCEAHAINDVVQAAFEQLQQHLARGATLGDRLV